ncbi:TRAP transporter small permease [Aliifodinibius sp. S!AR15-10]|uniref:TRAP transporter small permease n=1 Tax=Aliifodinibius sp. S!AR15-10 TaxID=2950437 RepID=UPI00285AFBCC|nr:TRAP transporter small permease [Aliifodinibius sp. S!AR15-10]MDR8394687.1 TRAP transporter small permease [Aliifodinibius sp. S!AR15-10]
MRDTVDTITRYTLVFLMGLLVVDVVWQVFTRYILASPSTFTDELARFLLIWVSLLGGAYASGKHMHLSIDLFSHRLSPRGQQKLAIIIYLIIIAFVTTVLIIGGSMLVYYVYIYGQRTSALQIPMAYIYLIGPISGLLILYYKVSDIKRLMNQTPAEIKENQ